MVKETMKLLKIPILLDRDKENIHVIVKVNGNVIYDKVVSTENEWLDVYITGKGRVWVDIYFDDVLKYWQEVALTD